MPRFLLLLRAACGVDAAPDPALRTTLLWVAPAATACADGQVPATTIAGLIPWPHAITVGTALHAPDGCVPAQGAQLWRVGHHPALPSEPFPPLPEPSTGCADGPTWTAASANGEARYNGLAADFIGTTSGCAEAPATLLLRHRDHGWADTGLGDALRDWYGERRLSVTGLGDYASGCPEEAARCHYVLATPAPGPGGLGPSVWQGAVEYGEPSTIRWDRVDLDLSGVTGPVATSAFLPFGHARVMVAASSADLASQYPDLAADCADPAAPSCDRPRLLQRSDAGWDEVWAGDRGVTIAAATGGAYATSSSWLALSDGQIVRLDEGGEVTAEPADLEAGWTPTVMTYRHGADHQQPGMVAMAGRSASEGGVAQLVWRCSAEAPQWQETPLPALADDPATPGFDEAAIVGIRSTDDALFLAAGAVVEPGATGQGRVWRIDGDWLRTCD